MVREIERGERKVYVMVVLAGGSVGDGGIGCSIVGLAMVVMGDGDGGDGGCDMAKTVVSVGGGENRRKKKKIT